MFADLIHRWVHNVEPTFKSIFHPKTFSRPRSNSDVPKRAFCWQRRLTARCHISRPSAAASANRKKKKKKTAEPFRVQSRARIDAVRPSVCQVEACGFLAARVSTRAHARSRHTDCAGWLTQDHAWLFCASRGLATFRFTTGRSWELGDEVFCFFFSSREGMEAEWEKAEAYRWLKTKRVGTKRLQTWSRSAN